jgi:hypothetical protein
MTDANRIKYLRIALVAVGLTFVAHGGVMAVQSFSGDHRGHMIGDVGALFAVAALLAWLMPRDSAAR